MQDGSISDHVIREALEHTLLSAATTPSRIETLCAEAIANGFAAVCVNPVHVSRCRRFVQGSQVKVVSVLGFPLGATYTRCKLLECELAIADGADELDMVMHLSAAKAGDWAAVEADAAAVVRAAQGRPLKLILETGLLQDDEKRRACQVATNAGVAFVKTCTGFATGAASVEDVRLLERALGGRIAIKASGGIKTAGQARALIAAGAKRLGTSAGLAIAAELQPVVPAHADST